MPIVPAEGRTLGSVESISALLPIEGADRIELAHVKGWEVVVGKGLHEVGDLVGYFEIDSCLDTREGSPFEFLAARGEKSDGENRFHVLKTAKLRGKYSQGLIVPLSELLFYPDSASEGDDLTHLTLGKWDVPLPNAGNGVQAGSFLTQYARKTDSERAQNIKCWDNLAEAGGWTATEKIDGTSCTILRDEDGQIRICSRNWEIKDGDNLYWTTYRKYIEKYADFIKPYDVLQLEIAGPGIQGNPLKLDTVTPLLFHVQWGEWVPPRWVWHDWMEHMSAPVYNIPFPASAAEAVAQVDGIKSLVNPKVKAEGVVWHSGQNFPELGVRNTFKVISNAYLLKQKG